MAAQALRSVGCTPEAARLTAEHYVDAECRGKRTHGIVKFLKELCHVPERLGDPEVVRDMGSTVLLDGRRELGPVAARYCADLVVERAGVHGIAMVGISNIQRYGTLAPWVHQIAMADMVGLVTNTCEAAMAPYGGIDPVLGTNPIAIGFPTLDDPVVIDLTTAKAPMSLLLLGDLPAETFRDSRGTYTTDPERVHSVEPFGQHRGYALALGLQVFAGSLIAAPMGNAIAGHYDIGYSFIAINPKSFTEISEFKRSNTRLLEEVRTSRPSEPDGAIHIPGETETGFRETFEIPDDLYREFVRTCEATDAND